MLLKSLKLLDFTDSNEVLSFSRDIFFRRSIIMKLVRCPNCGFVCKRNGKTNAGSQRWYCNQCSCSFTNKVNKTNNNLQMFLDWLFGKHTQLDMAGDGRSFRRKTSQFWELWPLPPKLNHQVVWYLLMVFI